jgi:hypothetical protein
VPAHRTRLPRLRLLRPPSRLRLYPKSKWSSPARAEQLRTPGALATSIHRRGTDALRSPPRQKQAADRAHTGRPSRPPSSRSTTTVLPPVPRLIPRTTYSTSSGPALDISWTSCGSIRIASPRCKVTLSPATTAFTDRRRVEGNHLAFQTVYGWGAGSFL